MSPQQAMIVLLALTIAASGTGVEPGPRGPRRRLGNLTGSVSNRVLEELDVDAVVRRVDVDHLVQRVDVDALLRRVDVDDLMARVDVDALLRRVDVNDLMARVDVEALVARVDVDALLARVDVNALLDRVDPDRLLDRVDPDRLLDRVDPDRLLQRVDVDALADRLDLDRLLAGMDVDALVRRAGIPELVADSTGQAANSALDLLRRQLVGIDVAVSRLTQRLMGRDPADLPPGPPLLRPDQDGEVTAPEVGRPRRRVRVEVSGNYAGFISRAVAFGADTALATATFTAVAASLSWLLAVVTGSGFDTTERSGPGWAIALAAWLLLWWWGATSLAGRTPAMAIVGLKVVTREGAPVRPGWVLVRTLALPVSFLVVGLGVALIVVDRERRALHDRAARTAVVYDWGGRPAELPTPIGRWVTAQADVTAPARDPEADAAHR